MNQQTSKSHADSAHLLRAIERGIVYDRLPAPTAINIQPEYGAAKLRFATAEDVHEWRDLTGATVVTGPYVYREGTDSPWHEVGTEQGGKAGELVGWQVSMWASVAGLPPSADVKAVLAEAGRAMTATGDVEVYEPPADGERVWVFTFGSGQEHDGMYVLIYGTSESARAEMVRVFGNRWSHQYESTDAAGVKEFGLTRLPEALWPEPADEATATPTQHAGR